MSTWASDVKLGLIQRLRVMDASLLHADLLFTDMIEEFKAKGQVKLRSCPTKTNLMLQYVSTVQSLMTELKCVT